MSLCDAIFESVDLEQQIYVRSIMMGSTNVQTESRLQRASILLKRLTGRWLSSMKGSFKPKHHQKLIRQALGACIYTGPDGEKRFLDPVVLNLTIALNQFLQEEALFNHLSQRDVDRSLGLILDYLSLGTKDEQSSLNERHTVELFEALYIFLDPPNCFNLLISESDYKKMIVIVFNFYRVHFEATRKESQSLVLVLKTVNRMLANLCVVNIKYCYLVSRIGIRFFANLRVVSYDSIKRELSVFMALIPDFLKLDYIPKLPGDSWDFMGENIFSSEGERTSKDEVSVVIDSEEVVLSDEEPEHHTKPSSVSRSIYLKDLKAIITLGFNMLINDKYFSFTEEEVSLNPFGGGSDPDSDLGCIGLQKHGNMSSWIHSIGLCNIISKFFEWKSIASDHSSLMFSRKRRKVDLHADSSVESYLDECTDTMDMILTMMGRSADHQLQGLKLFIFHVCTVPLHQREGLVSHTNAHLTCLLKVFENQSDTLNFWSLLACRCLLLQWSYDNTLSEKFPLNQALVSRVLKYSISMLKTAHADIACLVLSQLIELSSNHLRLSRTDVHKLEALIELSTISGPSSVTVESLVFWFSICDACRSLKVKRSSLELDESAGIIGNGNIATKVQAWLMSRWDQVTNITSPSTLNVLALFVSWLSGCADIKVSAGTNQKQTYGEKPFMQWKKYSFFRRFLLLHREGEIPQKGLCIEAIKLTCSVHVDSLLVALSKTISSQQKQHSAESWCFVGLLVHSKIKDNPKFQSYADSLEFQICRLLEDNLKLDVSIERCARLFKHFDQMSHMEEHAKAMLRRNISLDRIIGCAAREINHHMSDTRAEHVGDFDAVRSFTAADNRFQDDNIIKFLRSISSREVFFDLAVSFLDSLKSNADYLKYAHMVVLEGDFSAISLDQLSSLIRAVGVRLLGDFDLERKELTIITVSRLLIKVSTLWTDAPESLRSDFLDIFSFLAQLDGAGLVQSELAKCELKRVYIRMLANSSSDMFMSKNELMACLQRLCQQSRFIQTSEIGDLVALISSVDSSKQLAIYSALYEMFEAPQQSIESTSAFCYFFSHMGNSSNVILTSCVCNLLEFSQFTHLAPYVDCAVNVLQKAGAKGLNRKEFFRSLRLPVLKCWWSFSLKLTEFPYKLMGYTELEQFINHNSREIVAIICAIQRDDDLTQNKVMKNLKSISSITCEEVESLVVSALSLCIALSFTPGGIRNDIYALMSKLLGASKLEGALKNQLPLFVATAVELCDVSDEANLAASLGGDCSDLFSSGLILKSSLLHCEISCKTAIHLLKETTLKRNFGSVQSVYFVTKKLLGNTEDKLLLMRRLKLVVKMYAASFKSDPLVELIVERVSPYLHNSLLFDDVSRLLECVLISSIHSGSLPFLMKNIAKAYKRHGLVSAPLAGWIDSRLTDEDVLLKAVAEMCKGYIPDLSIEDVEQIIVSSPDIEVLSLVFEGNKDLDRTEIVPKLEVFEALSKMEVSKTCHSFQLWRARYIGKCYLWTGVVVDTDECEFDLGSYDDNFALAVSNLNQIFSDMVAYSRSLKTQRCLDSIVGVLLWKNERTARELARVVDLELIFPHANEFLLPMDFELCMLVTAEFETDKSLLHTATVNEFTSRLEHTIQTSSFEEWTTKLVFSLINELAVATSVAPLIAIFVGTEPAFARRALVSLILFHVVRRKGLAAGRLVKQFFSIPKEKVPNEALELFLEIVMLIRVGYRSGMSEFETAFSELNLKEIYQGACFIHRPKTSLLLFEDMHSGSEDWRNETDFLTRVYSAIDEPDVERGLPVRPTLQYALSMMSDKRSKHMGQNGCFNAAVSSGEAHSHYTSLITSTSDTGFTGLAQALAEGTSQSMPEEQMCSLWWRLNQWDLPCEEKSPSSENVCLYAALKNIHDDNSQSAAVTKVEQYLCDMGRAKFSATRSWFRTLACLVSLEEVLSLNGSNVESRYLDYGRRTKWFKEGDFQDCENLLLVRKSALEILSSKSSGDEYQLPIIYELYRYGEVSRGCGRLQNALNAAIYLDKLVEKTSGELYCLVSEVSKFQYASTFWMQGETDLPVVVVKQLRHLEWPSRAFSGMMATRGLANATLAKWTSQSRQEVAGSIMKTYVEAAISDNHSNVEQRALTFHILAEFCDTQLRALNLDQEIERHLLLRNQKKSTMDELERYVKDGTNERNDRKDAQKMYKRQKLQYEVESCEVERLQSEKGIFVSRAIEFYLQSITLSDDYDFTDIDRFCAMWLEYSGEDRINDIVSRNISHVPSYKLIAWVNQLMSRLLDETSSFQTVLQRILLTISYRHPFHCLYLLKSLRLHLVVGKPDAAISSRSQAAKRVWERLAAEEASFTETVMNPINKLCDMSLRLANQKLSKSAHVALSEAPNGSWWLSSLPPLPPPTRYIPTSKNGDYSSVPRIASVDDKMSVAHSGISLPKIMKLRLTNGYSTRMLLKSGADDLRQDAIMEQVFEKVNLILSKDKDARQRNLRARTYKVVPLGPQAGVIEFVANSIALHDILKPLHERTDSITCDQARSMMKKVQASSSDEKVKAFTILCDRIRPVLSHFFFDNFISPDKWFSAKIGYTHGIATMSMLGHVLGLGDRHNNNILLDKSSGEPVHIDLGVAFDQGRMLPIPELVPFRLTRDIIDGFGVTGTEGVFRESCGHVFRILRGNKSQIMGILDVLKYDPLYVWTLSPLRRKRLQEGESGDLELAMKQEREGSEASVAINGVQAKLHADGLSTEAAVRELIQEAVNIDHLSSIYLGWCPFY